MDKPREGFVHEFGVAKYVYLADYEKLKSAYDRLEKQNQILREALEHCRDFDTSAKFGYEYGQKVRGHIPKPGTRFKTPKEMAQQALVDAER